MDSFLLGFERGSRCFASRNTEAETVLVAQAEVVGGEYLEGFNEALAFASFLWARAVAALA